MAWFRNMVTDLETAIEISTAAWRHDAKTQPKGEASVTQGTGVVLLQPSGTLSSLR